MAEDERGTKTRLGPLLLGSCHDELGPGLGRLYEAWQEDTGEPVLLLRPAPQVDWSPAEHLKLQLFFNPDVSAVTVKSAALVLLAASSSAPAAWQTSGQAR